MLGALKGSRSRLCTTQARRRCSRRGKQGARVWIVEDAAIPEVRVGVWLPVRLLKTSVERRSSTIKWRKERNCARMEVNKCQADEVKLGGPER
jgi:hypothetical protein